MNPSTRPSLFCTKQQTTLQMLGAALKKEPTIIIGAGIAGLSLGYFLKKAGIPITIYEKESRAGGLLGTHKGQYGLAEQAANGFLWSDAIGEICNDLGLSVLGPRPEQKARYLVRNNKMTRMPLSPLELGNVLRKAILPRDTQTETVREFGEAYFGQKFTDYILEPALLGIYSGKSAELSFEAILGSRIAPLIEGNQSLVWGGLKKSFNGKNKGPKKPKGSQSFQGGMQELIDALSEHLKNEIQYNTTNNALIDDSLSEKNLLQTQQIVLCTPAYAASEYLSPPLSNLLSGIEYNSMITTTLFVKKSQVEKFKAGFGCLISQKEGYTILGVLFNSCIFENRVFQDDYVSLTAMLRDFDGQLFPKDNTAILNIVQNDLQRLLGLNGPPIEHKIFRWKKGIPLYSPQLLQTWRHINNKLEQLHPNVRLFGNYTGQISIRGMADLAKELVPVSM